MKRNLRFLFFPVTVIIVGMIAFLPTFFDSSVGRTERNQKIYSPLFDAYGSDIILLFFGYAGCVDVCTPRMEEIAAIYSSIREKKEVQVLFVNLIPPADPGLPDRFARFFHPDFQGIYPGGKMLELLKKEFGLYVVRSLFDEYEYDHTSFLFMLQKEAEGYVLKYIYRQAPFDQTLILQDIEKRGRE